MKVLLGEHDHTKTSESRLLVKEVKQYVAFGCPGGREGETGLLLRQQPFTTFILPFPIRRRIHVHPEFEWWLVHNDFALLELSAPVDLAAHPHVRPICYPTQQPRAGDEVGRNDERINGRKRESI